MRLGLGCWLLTGWMAAMAMGIYDVREQGAVGDGRTLDTAPIRRAVEKCAAAGGGQVRFPPGRYLTGTIQLASRVTLCFEPGAVVIGTTNLAEYQHFQPPAGTPEARFRAAWHRALFLADGVEDVAFVGPGILDGNRVFDPQGEERMRGPHTIVIGNSRGLSFRDLTVRDSANYALLLEHCQEVEVRGVRFTGGWDGVHFRGWPDRPCRDVRIIDCQFYTGDDAIAGRYWEHVLITGCVINSACNGIRLIGPARQLIVHDCLFYGPGVHPHRTSNRHNMLAAVNLQPGAWDATEGLLDDVLLSDLTMRRVATPFHFALKPGNTAGSIHVQRVDATGVYRAAASVESWAATPFTNVVFRDVSIEFEGGGTAAQARGAVKSPGIDARPLPAWGFYARQVEQLTLDNVRLSRVRDDRRPVLLGERVERLQLLHSRFTPPPEGTEAIALREVDDVRIEGAEPWRPATTENAKP